MFKQKKKKKKTFQVQYQVRISRISEFLEAS